MKTVFLLLLSSCGYWFCQRRMFHLKLRVDDLYFPGTCAAVVKVMSLAVSRTAAHGRKEEDKKHRSSMDN